MSATSRQRITSLRGLREAEARCTRCPLYKHATQVVPGEGARRAPVMLVGEQPGDREDKQGRPFVGPAGGVLDRALEDAGIDRRDVFVTNAVKHFKFEPRGKKRLHKRPNAYEIERCRWWFGIELDLVNPKVIVALGATAARSVLGRAVPIGKSRGKVFRLEGGAAVIVMTHPSALLRIPEEAERRAQFRRFAGDLRRINKLLKE